VSHTWDEPAHLANGLLLLDDGEYIEYQHPPLARLATAIGPYLWGARAEPPPAPAVEFVDRILLSFDEGRRIMYGSGSYERVLLLARLGILPFFVLALVATFIWTRRLLGEWEAAAATFFLATTPIVLGNAGIATLDIPFAGLAVACLLVFCGWLDRPTTGSGAALGALAGAAVMSKFSAIPFLGLCFGVIALWYTWLGRQARPLLITSPAHLKTAAVACGTFLLVGWLSFGGGFVSVADPADRPYARVDAMFEPGSAPNRVASNLLELKVVPFFVWAVKEGVDDVSFHNRGGHLSYLLGEVSEEGWWNYYLVGLGVRTPLPLLVVGLVGLGMMLRSSARSGNWQLGAPALCFVAVLVFCSVYSRINLGIRHILMLYPLLAIGAGFVIVRIARAGWARQAGAAAAAVLLLAQGSSMVLAHPDHLTHFNLIAGDRPEDYLISADLDWGQDMWRLEDELRARGVSHVSISFYGSNDLSKHDLPPYTPLEPGTPTTGWIAVSIWRVVRSEDFAWLRAHEPVARVGRSVDLYYIDPDATSPHEGQTR
jgi:hypothetical protein